MGSRAGRATCCERSWWRGWGGREAGASENHPSPFPALGLLHPRLQLRSPCWSRSWSWDCLALGCSPAMAQDGCWLGPSMPDDLVQGPPHLSFYLSDGLVCEPPQNWRSTLGEGLALPPYPPAVPAPLPALGGQQILHSTALTGGGSYKEVILLFPSGMLTGPDPLQRRRLGRRKGARV